MRRRQNRIGPDRITDRITDRIKEKKSKFKIQDSKFKILLSTRVTTVSRTFYLIQVWYSYIPFYYMASSVSGQDESNPALWLATRAGKMGLSCPLGSTRRAPQEKFPRRPYNKSFIDQACLVKMAGYWPRSFFASLWTETESRSINT